MKRDELIFKKKLNGKIFTCGFSSVEALLSAAVFALLVTALTGVYLYGEESTLLSGARVRATMYAEEGIEAVRNIRDNSFANLTDGTYGLGTAGNQWNLTGSSDTNGIFTRTINISTVDTRRKAVTSTVTWQQNLQRSGTVSVATRFTDWLRSSIGDWSLPFVEASINVSGNQNGSKIQTEGNYAYMIRTDGTPDFLVIDVSTPSAPTTVGSLSLAGIPQNIFVLGNYAYVTNNSDTQELQIIDITTPSTPSVVGTYDDAGIEDARGVYVVGNNAYLAMNGGNDFVMVDVTNKNAPVFSSGLVLGGTAFEVAVSGNLAYLASDSDTQELQVVNLSTNTLTGSLNLGGTTNATTLAYDGNNLFMGQGTNFRLINISDITPPIVPVLLGTLATGGNTNDIALNTGASGAYVYIATASNTAEFQVVDILTTPGTPVLFGSTNVTGNDDMMGVAYNSVLDRAFGASSSNTLEFLVFAPN